MRSMNPDAPNFVDASAAAARYANFVNEPKYQVANAYFDSLQKEKEAAELKAENLRRYNQEFGLKQAEANRQQSKYDRELNTDKALIDFQNQIGRASAGGAMSDQQGAQLGDEFDRLSKTVGEDEAARIINDKAQKFGAQDAKRAEGDPYYRAELIKGVALPYGNIDPKSLIDLRNSQIIRNETLGQRKDDLETRAKERAEDLWFKKQELVMRQAERNERSQEKLNAKKAVAELVGVSMNEDPNMSSSGVLYNVNQVKTGNKTIPNGVSIPEGEGSEDLSKMKIISDKIDALASKNKINYEDRDKAFEAYKKENPEAANSSEAGKVVDRAFEGAVKNVSDGMINGMSLPGKILAVGLDKAKPLFMTDIEREEYNKKLDESKAKELQESLKSDSPGEKAKPGNISFDDYWKLKKDQQALDDAELKKLQKELEDTGLTYYKNLANTYGVDEIKSVPKEMTPYEAKIHVTKNTVKSLIARGVSEENALKLGVEEGDKAEKKQANYINNVNEDAKEKAKNRYTEVKEAKKAIENKIETLEKTSIDIGKGNKDEIFYDSEELEIPEAQKKINDEISILRKKLAELK